MLTFELNNGTTLRFNASEADFVPPYVLPLATALTVAAAPDGFHDRLFFFVMIDC